MRIDADGLPFPVPAYVLEGSRLEGGLPLGGLGTGYMTEYVIRYIYK